MTAIWYVPMNTNIAPFNNLKARQARQLRHRQERGGEALRRQAARPPTCTILPPGFPGYVESCAYNKGTGSKYNGPDLAKAKALVKASGTKGDGGRHRGHQRPGELGGRSRTCRAS